MAGCSIRCRFVRWPVTVGRALDCDVVLHDPHVAAHHATLDLVAGGVPGLVAHSRASVNWRALARAAARCGRLGAAAAGDDLASGKQRVARALGR